MKEQLQELRRIFAGTTDKRAAHHRAESVLRDLIGDPAVLSYAIRTKISAPGGLTAGHYPVIALPIESNPWFELVANCWIPLPDRSIEISTKAVHHHGNMLLTTVTAFGPGYEHWMFTPPEVIDAGLELFRMDLLERSQHPLGHAAFVDAHVAHVPMYVPSLTVTLALWSSSNPVSWTDRIKRVPAIQRRSRSLRSLGIRLGLQRALDLKAVSYFDFYPTDRGFVGLPDRTEFDLGPNADFVQSLCHVIQTTDNQSLVPVLRARATSPLAERHDFLDLLRRLEADDPIEPRLSPGHHDIPHANFSVAEIQRALSAQSPAQRK